MCKIFVLKEFEARRQIFTLEKEKYGDVIQMMMQVCLNSFCVHVLLEHT